MHKLIQIMRAVEKVLAATAAKSLVVCGGRRQCEQCEGKAKRQPASSQDSPGVGSVVVCSSFPGLVPGHMTLDLDVNEEHETGFGLEEDCPPLQDQAQRRTQTNRGRGLRLTPA